MPGYNIVRYDHPPSTKYGEVYFYYRNTLPFKLINIKYLQECISFEIRIGEKCWKLICLYRSASQTNEKFKSFLKNFEVTLNVKYISCLMTVLKWEEFFIYIKSFW